MKPKSSSSTPHDRDSVEQAIMRANFQVFHWLTCCKINIEQTNYEGNGWKWDDVESSETSFWSKEASCLQHLLGNQRKVEEKVRKSITRILTVQAICTEMLTNSSFFCILFMFMLQKPFAFHIKLRVCQNKQNQYVSI